MSDVAEVDADAGDAGDAGTEAAEVPAATEAQAGVAPENRRRRTVAFVVLPAVLVLLGGVAGYVTWDYSSRRDAAAAAVESVAAARDATTAMLSYRAESVEADLGSAKDRLTGSFLESYNQLVTDVVIPGAKERTISAAAEVAAAASVSATPTHAVTLLFVNQTVTVGGDAPTTTPSSVRVTLDKVGGRWLVSGFEPV